jgi:hypothetical protein
MVRRRYVSIGGARARAGFQFRWEMIRQAHADPNHRQNQPDLSTVLDIVIEGALPRTSNTLRNKVIRAIAQEVSGLAFPAGPPLWLQPHVKGAIKSLSWPNQTPATTRDLLKLLERILTQVRRQAQGPQAA